MVNKRPCWFSIFCVKTYQPILILHYNYYFLSSSKLWYFRKYTYIFNFVNFNDSPNRYISRLPSNLETVFINCVNTKGEISCHCLSFQKNLLVSLTMRNVYILSDLLETYLVINQPCLKSNKM